MCDDFVIDSVKNLFYVNENTTREIMLIHTISKITWSGECALRKPYCEECVNLFLSIKSFILQYCSFSNILLKFDKREIGR